MCADIDRRHWRLYTESQLPLRQLLQLQLLLQQQLRIASQQIRIASQRVASHRIALLTLTGQAAGRQWLGEGGEWVASCCVAPKRRGSMSYKEQTAFGKGKGCHIEYMPGPVVRLPRVARDDKCSRGDDEDEEERWRQGKMKTTLLSRPDVVWVNNLQDVCR